MLRDSRVFFSIVLYTSICEIKTLMKGAQQHLHQGSYNLIE